MIKGFQIKRIYDDPHPSDGRRILIDRLWPRGVSKNDAVLDEWMKEVAPSTELRQWFQHNPERFAEFERKYREELSEDVRRPYIDSLCEWAQKGRVTLLYSAKDPKHNQAVVLLEYLNERLKN